MSKEFGWTPEQIDSLTEEIVVLYLDRIIDYYKEQNPEKKKGNDIAIPTTPYPKRKRTV